MVPHTFYITFFWKGTIMNPKDNLPGPDDYGFLDEWENETEKHYDPLAENPLDPLSNILDTAQQQIEGTAPIAPIPPDIPTDVFPDKPNDENEEATSDMDKDNVKDNAEFPTPTEKHSLDVGPSSSTRKIQSRSPLFDIYNGRGRSSHIPPPRLSHGRSGAGLGHGTGRNSVWCTKQQDYVDTEGCQDCGYYDQDEQDPDRRCTHPDRE